MLGFYCGYSNWNYAINIADNPQIDFDKELIAEKWYKVVFVVFCLKFPCSMKSIFLKYSNIFKIDIKQSKGSNNQCYATIWWQNELIFHGNYSCPSLNSDMGLYVAASYKNVLNGQVRNFSYVKK